MTAMDKATAEQIGDICMGLHVRRAARRITRMYDASLAPVDLTIGQFSLLTLLAGRERWAMQSLAEALGTDRTSLTATLKPLERRQLVSSSRNDRDGRVRCLALTNAGHRVLDKAIILWSGIQERVTDLVGPNEAAQLRSTLARLI